MSKRLDETMNDVAFDNATADVAFPQAAHAVTIEAGQGKLTRFSLLDEKANGKMCLFGLQGYAKTTAGTTGALEIVASGATTGQINLADVTPLKDTTYVPAVGEYVLKERCGEPYGILAEEADATSADAETIAIITGKFNKNNLFVATGYTITEADFEDLRDKGILLAKSV